MRFFFHILSYALMGYAEPVPANLKPGGIPQSAIRLRVLTREKAEELLADIDDHAAEINLKDEYPVRITKIGAFGGIMTKHDRIQDMDLIVTLEPKLKRQVTEADRRAALKALKGKLPALKPRVWEPGLADLPVRVIFEE